ncbi:glycosyltransferase [Clostridium bowmanii]|uniref:glycosyltransferase family 2 protein n=1 Tax=Clostridium bowmanii TaxID=132925 RepID=UPI001C0C0825|nr:glycosyltransferase family 2 protein [Clostridium bowmanii]MBU3190603.1 glycosyltransferase [Clostridium bowmanii]MCA1075136.1 glycosyltransferase [Clostridium bowmanii]
MLTLCMIVKNEENNLKKCLLSIATFVDEIVIVDTGSTDNTKIIASEYTDKIYDYIWCNDFSKARNFSISKASNDWVLILDADEIIELFDRGNILMFTTKGKNKIGRIERLNIMETPNGINKQQERINRLFNKDWYQYEGIIHEQVVSIDNCLIETEDIAIRVEHIGYTISELSRTNKLSRNVSLLNEAILGDPNDPYLYYQLGKSYYVYKEYERASLFFEKALSYKIDYNLEYVGNLIETYGYSMVNNGKYKKALVLEEYEKYYNNADFYFLMGHIYMNNSKFEIAVENFLKCTKFEFSKVQGVNTYLAFYNIGVIYDVLGFMEKAIEYYRMCGKYNPALIRLRQQLN